MGNLNPISLDSSRFDYHFVVPSSEFVARLNVKMKSTDHELDTNIGFVTILNHFLLIFT